MKDAVAWLSRGYSVARGWVATVFLVCVVALPTLVFVANRYWPFRYEKIRPLLENVFASQIKIDHYHCIYLPHPGFVADGLTLRRNTAPDLPPVGSAEHLRVEGAWIDLLLLRRQVRLVEVEGLHVVIPAPGSRANREDFPPGSSTDFAGPTTGVEEFRMNHGELDLERSSGGQYAFPIRRLVIGNLRRGQTISYDLDMENAQPSGHILAHGSFGPLLPKELGATPVQGDYVFGPIRLADVNGISGGMSAQGRLWGTIADIETEADTKTPDFAVGKGRPTLVLAKVKGAVNGLNGDVVLHDVDVRTGKTTIQARGEIKGSPKLTRLDISVLQGRAEDILQPFVHGVVPVTGAVRLHTLATIGAAGEGRSFFNRLRMDGAFDIPTERITNQSTEKKLSAFSDRAREGSPAELKGVAADRAADQEVLSDLGGGVTIREGIAHVRALQFRVPGATVIVHGTYSLKTREAYLLGDLRMQNDISHTTTGWKSMLLKPVAPLFRKGRSGTVLPIAITGSPGAYKAESDIMHHK